MDLVPIFGKLWLGPYSGVSLLERCLRLPVCVTPVGISLDCPRCKHPGVWHQMPKGTHPGDRLEFSSSAATPAYLTHEQPESPFLKGILPPV